MQRGIELLQSVIQCSWSCLAEDAESAAVCAPNVVTGRDEAITRYNPLGNMTLHYIVHHIVTSWEHRMLDWSSVFNNVLRPQTSDTQLRYLPSEAVEPSATHPTGSFKLAWTVLGSDAAAVRRTEHMVKVFAALPVPVLLERYPHIKTHNTVHLLCIPSLADSREPARYECHLHPPLSSLVHKVCAFLPATATAAAAAAAAATATNSTSLEASQIDAAQQTTAHASLGDRLHAMQVSTGAVYE